MRTLKTIITLTAFIIAITTGARAASERRAEYLEQESEYYSCIESGLDRTECALGVGL